MKWKWLNSSGRAGSQTASSQIPEVWALGSPQHVLFNKHPHTWPFTPAVPSLPQRLELSTVALAPWSLGSAFQFQVDLGWAPHMVILVRVENLRHRFLHLASLQSFLVLRHTQPPADTEHKRERSLTRNLCWLNWIGLWQPCCWVHGEKSRSWVRSQVFPGLVSTDGHVGLSLTFSVHTLPPTL